jgi:pyruvate kinase
MIKKILSALVIAAFTTGFAATVLSAEEANAVKASAMVNQVKMEKVEQCIITKIEGAKINLQNDKDEQFAMTVNDSKTLQDLKVGDKVLLKDGKIIKEKEE